jgi:multidrug resistance efflux pump
MSGQGLYAMRQDLKTSVRFEQRGHRVYIFEDPDTGGRVELGEEEHFIAMLLNGKFTLPIVQTAFTKRFNVPVSLEHLNDLVGRLKAAGLLVGERKATGGELFESTLPDTWKRHKFFDPDRFFTALAGALGWAFTKPAMTVWGCLLALAAMIAYQEQTRLLYDLKRLFDELPLHQVFLAGYLFVNIPGEITRGVACARFGGRVDEFGLWYAYDFIPKFYCRGRVWEISSKKGRAWVFFSAAYYSLFVAAAGMIFWSMTDASSGLHTFFLIIGIAGLLDGTARLIALLPTDGQYLFDNWMEIPAFRSRAVSAAAAWLSGSPLPEKFSKHDRRLFVGYGMAALAFTTGCALALVFFGAAELIRRMEGAGALIIILTVIFKYRNWLSRSIRQQRAVQYIMKIIPKANGKLRKRLLIAAALLFLFIPYPYETGGPFRFLSLKNVEVHSQVSGEIVEVLVKEGDSVKSGDALARLDDREHRKNYEATKANLDKAAADLKLLKSGAKPEEVTKARQQLEAARTHYEFSKKEAVRLEALHKGGAVSQEEYEAAAKTASVDEKKVEIEKANLDLVMSGARAEEIEAQEALVRDLDARLRFYSENLARCVIKAPVSGQVATAHIDKKVGGILTENDLFAVIHDASTIQAEIYLPEAFSDESRVGARVKVRPWAYPTSLFFGSVVAIAPSAEESAQGKVVRVLTEIPNPQMMLKPDMTGEAKIESGWKPLIVAFTGAIVRFVMVEVWSWLP